MRTFSLSATVVLLLAVSSAADDLWKVFITSRADAVRLSELPVSVVSRIRYGYLVLTDGWGAQRLHESGLRSEVVATDLDRSRLAFDRRRDDHSVSRYPVIYQEGGLRILEVSMQDAVSGTHESSLIPVITSPVRILYKPCREFNWNSLNRGIDLDSLIGLVEKDSLMSYAERIQAFFRRVTGTDSNYACSDWLLSKFQEFGYDSVYFDTFTTEIYDEPTLCRNVVAVKPGWKYPHRQIIIGGHFDAVPGSPGADDNASGTVSTMEMARVMRNIETELTYIFIAFDAEEQGLHGSRNYADNAAARNDTIIYLLNSDMVGHITNSDRAFIGYIGDSTYSMLWIGLADSLLGLTGYLAEFGGDHMTFARHGYITSGIVEFDLSTHYHDSSDSTTYLNFDYMTLMTKASLATIYAVMQDALVPGIIFDYPDGFPDYIAPGEPTAIEVTIATLGDGEMVPGSQTLHYSVNGGPITSVEMAEIATNRFEASLPSLYCEDVVSFYVSADELSTGTYYDTDPSDPHIPPIASTRLTLFEDNFETDEGWTVLGTAIEGHWERCVPVPVNRVNCPLADFDGSGRCFVTGNLILEDVEGGYTILTSPTFDMPEGLSRVRYARWFHNRGGHFPPEDSLTVYISSNFGINWTLAETVGPVEEAGGGWIEHEFWAGDYVIPGTGMKLRFVAADMGTSTPTEAALDAVRVTWYDCEYEEPPICGDTDDSGGVDVDDVVYVIAYIFSGGPEPEPYASGDADCSGTLDIDDVVYLVNFIFSGGHTPCDTDGDGMQDC